MQSTIDLTIPVKVEYFLELGEKPTKDNPGLARQISDITYSKKQIMQEVDKLIFGPESTIDQDIWNDFERQRDLNFEYGL
jgi:hypothetical protein